MFSLVLSLVACFPNETFLHRFDDNTLPDPSVDDSLELGDDQYGGTGWVIPDEDEPVPDLTPDGADVAWARAEGTPGVDQPDAVAALGEGRLVVSSREGLGLTPGSDLGAWIQMLDADGDVRWSRVLAPADSGVVVHTLLATDDDGFWACADIPGGAGLSTWLQPLPDLWGQSLVAMRFDIDGELLTMRALGAQDGGDVSGGCGLDQQGNLVMDGQVVGGPVELSYELGRLLLPALVDRGFALVLDDEGDLDHMSTWPAAGLSRVHSTVLPDGTMFQLVDYSGVPDVTLGVEQLPVCSDGQICRAMLAVDGAGAMRWLAGMGPSVGGAAMLSATADGGLLLTTRPAPGSYLPQGVGDDQPLSGDAAVVVRYSPELSISWTQRVAADLFVQTLADDGAGGALLGIFTGAAGGVELGDRQILTEHDDGSMVLAALDEHGQTDWLFAGRGTGTAWPTDLVMVDDELIVMGGLRGALVLDQGGETEVALLSVSDFTGAYTSDVLLTRLAMRWDE